MKHQYFIASRWRNKDSVLELTERLRAKSKSAHCFFENKHNLAGLDRDPEEVMREYEAIPNHNQFCQQLFL